MEHAILGLPAIRDVRVCEEADPLLGQVVVAKVSTIEPESAVALKRRIRHDCADRFTACMLPTKVLVAEDAESYSARLKKVRQA